MKKINYAIFSYGKCKVIEIKSILIKIDYEIKNANKVKDFGEMYIYNLVEKRK